jgi:hypothetical protein
MKIKVLFWNISFLDGILPILQPSFPYGMYQIINPDPPSHFPSSKNFNAEAVPRHGTPIFLYHHPLRTQYNNNIPYPIITNHDYSSPSHVRLLSRHLQASDFWTESSHLSTSILRKSFFLHCMTVRQMLVMSRSQILSLEPKRPSWNRVAL